MPTIHPFAVVDPAAELANDVVVGPFCQVGPHVKIGSGCVLKSHVLITGHTKIGQSNVFHHGAVIGEVPQDIKFHGEPAELIIGDANTFREYCTVHIGTEVAGNVTFIGNHNLFMVGAHIAHDCIIHDRNMLANNVLLAGHIHVGPCAFVGGGTAVQQFCTISRSAYVGGGVRLKKDAPPFCAMDEDPARPFKVNAEGMKRQGYSPDDIQQVKSVFRRLIGERKGESVKQVVTEMLGETTPGTPARELVEFYHARLDVPHGRLLECHRTDGHVDKSTFYRRFTLTAAVG